jgi:hypothetical protein
MQLLSKGKEKSKASSGITPRSYESVLVRLKLYCSCAATSAAGGSPVIFISMAEKSGCSIELRVLCTSGCRPSTVGRRALLLCSIVSSSGSLIASNRSRYLQG